MSNAIAERTEESASLLPSNLIVKIGSKEIVAELTKSVDYIPAMRVFDGAANVVKAGDMPAGEIAIYAGNKKFIKCGKEVHALVIGHRPRASIMQGGDQPINYWDETSEEFTMVTAKSKAGERNYNSGLEFLLYIASVKKFVCFFMGNKSGRREAPNLEILVGKAAIIRSRFIEKSSNSWWCAEVTPCTTPFEIPDGKEITKTIDLFKDPEKKADDKEDEGRAT
jgi:hypothetical protein